MDTSKEYQFMCESAEEIQDMWSYSKRNSGDWYFNMPLGRAYVITHEYQNDFDCTWLPRQDQLQEMVRDIKTTYGEIYHFNGWYEKERVVRNAYLIWSFEKLWLAFVMEEKFNKNWDGEKWVKNK